MPSQKSRPASNQDDNEEFRNDHDDLESSLSGERQRREGDDADLTELAAPAPIDRSYAKPDTLEKQESEVKHQRTRNSEHGEDGLTEIAAPVPVERRRSRATKDEEKAQPVDSPSADSLDDQELETKSSTNDTEYSHATTELYIHSHLVFFSILGTLARLGLEAITAYPNTPFLSTVLWANLSGSFFVGFLTEDRQIFRQEWGSQSEAWSFHELKFDEKDKEKIKNAHTAHGKVKKTIPLFIGNTVGFCGSLTSFSTLNRDVFLAAIDKLSGIGAGTNPTGTSNLHRNGGYGFEAAMGVLIIQVAVSIAALHTGAQLASAIDGWMPTLPFRFIRRVIDPVTLVVGFGCWIGAVLMSIWPPENSWRGQATFSLVLAPLGCLLRFHVSKSLNSRIPSFPLGTFCVNVFGTAVLGMCYDLQHSGVGGMITACQVLVGVEEGFCGCLTTVSTWVLEMNTLRARHAYIYGLMSVSVALGFLVAIIGTLEWTRGLATPVCSG
jgi:fluoride exporter